MLKDVPNILPQSGVCISALAYFCSWLNAALELLAPFLHSFIIYLMRTGGEGSSLETMRERSGPVLGLISHLILWPVVRTTRASPMYQLSSGTVNDSPPAYWYDLRRGQVPLAPSVIFVYVHGGGFCSHLHTDVLFAAAVLPRLKARGMQARVLSLDYTCAPMASRDTQLAQLMHGWRLLASSNDNAVLVLAGDSAGGHLVTSMVHIMCEQPVSRPARLPDVLLAISPWLAVVEGSPLPSHVRNQLRGTDFLSIPLLGAFSRAAAHGINHMLPDDVHKEDGHHAVAALLRNRPLALPWPTTAVFVGGGEILADDGRRLAASLTRLVREQRDHHGGDRRVKLFDVDDAVHVFPLLPILDVRRGDAARAMDATVDFVCNELLGSRL